MRILIIFIMNSLQTLCFSKISSQQTYFKDIPIPSLNSSIQDTEFSFQERSTSNITTLSRNNRKCFTNTYLNSQSQQYSQKLNAYSLPIDHQLSKTNSFVSYKQMQIQIQARNQIVNEYNTLLRQFQLLHRNPRQASYELYLELQRNDRLKEMIAKCEQNHTHTFSAIESYISQNINSYRDSILFTMMNQIDKFKYKYYDQQQQQEEQNMVSDENVNSCTFISSQDEMLKLLS